MVIESEYLPALVAHRASGTQLFDTGLWPAETLAANSVPPLCHLLAYAEASCRSERDHIRLPLKNSKELDTAPIRNL